MIVRAEGGFAYGVIGADIHVFGDGTPLYLLELWRVPRTPEPDWLLESPSRMLNARYEVADFTGREEDLAELHQWRDSRPRRAARWLYGPGGQGKTRLAAEFASRSADQGWTVVTAAHGPGTVHPPPGSQDLRLRHARGVLLIVDYADRWPLTHLSWLFSNALLHKPDMPTRILLLARTGDSWPGVRATLANHEASTSTHELAPLSSDGSAQRAEMYDAARSSFAAFYGIADPSDIPPPASLDHEDFGLTLAVHMAALVAVDARATGSRPPSDMAGLTVYLLDREHLHWARLHGDGTHELNPAERTYRTSPQVMNQVVFAAALTGAVPAPTGVAMLRDLGLELDAPQILTDHGVCYPPANPTIPTVLEPLYPDRLAEDFLALTLPGHTADYPAAPWAPATAKTVLTAETAETAHTARTWGPTGNAPTVGEAAPPPYLSRAIPTLTAAAERWPHVGSDYLYPLLKQHPQLAVQAGNAALFALAMQESADTDALEAIERLLPHGPHADLAQGIAAITYRVIYQRIERTDDLRLNAMYRTQLAERLHYAGFHELAADMAHASVEIWRRLADDEPFINASLLASSLNWYSTYLAKLGQREEALQTAEEAVALNRRLIDGDHTTSHDEQTLGDALGNLATRLSEVGRGAEALAAAEEAAAIRDRLGAAGVHFYVSENARDQLNLGARLADQGRTEEALAAIEKAVIGFRKVVEVNPAAHTFELATALNNYGSHLLEVDRLADALAAAEESVTLWRQLVLKSSLAHDQGLAMALFNLGTCKVAAGHQAEAYAATDESAKLYRKLAARNPAANDESLATVLGRLTTLLQSEERYAEALPITTDRVAVCRRLVAADPAAYEAGLAHALFEQSMMLSECNRELQARFAVEEAVDIHRRLAGADPAAHLPRLAQALYALSASKYDMHDDMSEVLNILSESMVIYQHLATADPETFADTAREVRATFAELLPEPQGL
ncbi:tetratricopeptide repeat protein [Saccharothrix saharensis]|uniref:Tetratricopeptide repeat protein n=1 Tax=Saccharothrix saharensis TaxID=571190 RepID=A0A543J5V6_9PSEU|nr:tetratricopeptide repeat protein [Saccharothrix saharensis]